MVGVAGFAALATVWKNSTLELIYHNVVARDFGQLRGVTSMPKMADRLLAHAKMCHEVASECGDENLAADFNKLALECIEAAAACKQQRTLH